MLYVFNGFAAQILKAFGQVRRKSASIFPATLLSVAAFSLLGDIFRYACFISLEVCSV